MLNQNKQYSELYYTFPAPTFMKVFIQLDTDFVSPAKYRELRSISCNLIEDIFLLAQPLLNNKEQNKNSLWIQF